MTMSSETSDVGFVPVDELDHLNIHQSMPLRIRAMAWSPQR